MHDVKNLDRDFECYNWMWFGTCAMTSQGSHAIAVTTRTIWRLLCLLQRFLTKQPTAHRNTLNVATVKRIETKDTTSSRSNGGSSLVKMPWLGIEINPCLLWFFNSASKSSHSWLGLVTGEGGGDVDGGIEYPRIDRAFMFKIIYVFQ